MEERESVQSAALQPVLYELGVVTYLSQQFEINLLFLICLVSDRGSQSVAEAVTTAFGNHSEKTLGQLAGALRARLRIPEGFAAFLKEGVDARNRIIHGFVQRNTERFWTKKGREELIDELREAQHIIGRRVEESSALLNLALSAFGKSLAELHKEAEYRFEPDDSDHLPWQ